MSKWVWVVVPFLCFTARLLAEEPLPSFLVPHRGHPVVIDLPDYEGFDVQILVPEDWRIVRADDKTVDQLLDFIGARTTPAVGYVDEHGNVLYVYESEKSRGRRAVASGYREFNERRKRLRRELDSRIAAAEAARQKERWDREVALLLEVRKLRVRGYSQMTTANTRIREIEGERLRALYRILAREGTVRSRKLLSELESLLEISIGLDVAGWIRRHVRLLEREVTVTGKGEK